MDRKVDGFKKTKLNLMALDIARHIKYITDQNLGTLIEVALQDRDRRNAEDKEEDPAYAPMFDYLGEE